MKILVLKTSGHRNGSSNMLADEFIKGATEVGNTVTEYNVFKADIRPCKGCNGCFKNDGKCVQPDDYETHLKSLIKESDMLVFVMPVYYYGWPATAKLIVDRFYSFNKELQDMKKKTVLIAAAYDDTEESFEIVTSYYKTLCNYMHFEDKGIIEGISCGTPEMTAKSKVMKEAYKLGKSLKVPAKKEEKEAEQKE